MESITAFSLATNVIQVVDFTSRLVAKGGEIYRNGALSEHVDLENITTQLIQFNKRLRTALTSRSSAGEHLTENEKVTRVSIVMIRLLI